MRRWPFAFWLLALLAGALLAQAVPVWADSAAPIAPLAVATPRPGGAPPPVSMPESTDPPPRTVTHSHPQAPGGTGTPDPAATATDPPTINVTTEKILLFPDKTFADAIVRVGTSILQQQADAATDSFAQRVLGLITDKYGLAPGYDPESAVATPLFQDLVHPQWTTALGVALALTPLTLALVVLGLMRAGAGSSIGVADLKEGLLGWFFSVALAGSSYFILAAVHALVTILTQAILTNNIFGASFSPADIVSGLKVGVFFSVLPLPIQLFLAFFTFITVIALTLSLGLALMAYVAITFVLSVLAPVVFVIASVPFLRWLHEVWLKALTQVFMLPVIDALLLRIALDLQRHLMSKLGELMVFTGDSQFHFTAVVAALLSVIVLLGLLSLLIGINFKIGQLVFGGLFQAAGQASALVGGVASGALNLLGAPAGYAAGSAMLGGVGGAGGDGSQGAETGDGPAGSGGSSGEGDGGSAEPGGADAPGTRPGAAFSNQSLEHLAGPSYRERISQLQQQERRARSVDSMGHALASSGIPGARQLGAGLSMAAARSTAAAAGATDQLRRQQQAERETRQDRDPGSTTASPTVDGVPRNLVRAGQRAALAQQAVGAYPARRAEQETFDQRQNAQGAREQDQRLRTHAEGATIDPPIKRDIDRLADANRAPAGAKPDQDAYRDGWSDWQQQAVNGHSPFADGLTPGQDNSPYFHWQAFHYSAARSPQRSGELAEMLYRPYHDSGHMTAEGLRDMERLFTTPTAGGLQANPLAQDAQQFIPAAHALSARNGFELPDNFNERAWRLFGNSTGAPDFSEANAAAVAHAGEMSLGPTPAGVAPVDLSTPVAMSAEPVAAVIDPGAAARFDELAALGAAPAASGLSVEAQAAAELQEQRAVRMSEADYRQMLRGAPYSSMLDEPLFGPKQDQAYADYHASLYGYPYPVQTQAEFDRLPERSAEIFNEWRASHRGG